VKVRAAIVLLFLGCLAAGWEVYRLHQQITQVGGTLAQHRTDGAALEKAQKSETALKDQLSALAKAASPPPSPGAPTAGSKSGKPTDAAAVQRAKVAFARNLLDAASVPVYAHLKQSLGLSDSQVDRLQNLNAERFIAMVDAVRQAQANGNFPRDSAPHDVASIQAVVAPAISGVETEMRQVLGDAGYAQFQQQIQLAPAEGAVQQMSQTLGSSTAPLSDAQKSQLAQLLTDTQRSPLGPVDPGSSLYLFNLNNNVTVTAAALTQAANILSPDQLQVLTAYQAVNQARQTVSQIVGKQFSALAPAKPAPAQSQ